MPALAASAHRAWPQTTPERGTHARAAAARQRVADRQRRILPGRDDHDDRDAQEGQQLGHGPSRICRSSGNSQVRHRALSVTAGRFC